MFRAAMSVSFVRVIQSLWRSSFMTKYVRLSILLMFVLVTAIAVQGCGGNSDAPTGGGGGGTGSTGGGTAPGDEGSEFIGDFRLCEAGDTARFITNESGVIEMQFPAEGSESPSDCTNNDDRDTRDDEYTLYFFNTTSSGIGFGFTGKDEDPFDPDTKPRTDIETLRDAVAKCQHARPTPGVLLPIKCLKRWVV